MMVETMSSVASDLNCLCPTKRIENSKLAVGFTPQFLCESSLFAEVHQYKSFFPEQYISCRCKLVICSDSIILNRQPTKQLHQIRLKTS